MRRLRECGFTNHELFVIIRGKISEVSIKRNTRGVEVRDTKEHDEVIELLADYADGGYEVSDIEDYKKSREILDNAKLTFDCAIFAENLLLLGVDTHGLLKLGEEIAGENLTAKSIRENIELNEDLAGKKITVEVQREIRDAAAKYGDPANILKIVNASGGLRVIASEMVKAQDELAQTNTDKDQARKDKERLVAETHTYKSYVDVARLLVTKYGFDLISLNELLSLAGKHDTPVGTIRAVNLYNEVSEQETKLKEVQTELRTTEEDLANKNTILKTKEEGLAKANQILGEIKANQAQSFRLQIVSDLIMKPKEAKATMNELAKIILLLLQGVRDYADYHQEESEKFRGKVGHRLNWIMQDLQEYLR